MGVIFIAKHQDADLLARVCRNYVDIKKNSISAGFSMPGKQFEEYLKKIAYIDLSTLDVTPTVESTVETITNCLQPLFAVKVHLNPSSDTQMFVQDLLMVQRLKNYSMSRLFCETIRACLMSLYNVSGGLRESIWCAFAFIKVPDILRQLYSMSEGYDEKLDYCPDVVKAIEQLCEDPILDFMDTKCACNTIELLLVELGKQHLVNEKHIKQFTAKRDTISSALMKIDLNNQQQQSPIKFVIRAESPFSGILKALSADYNKMQEALVSMLCQVLTGNSLELILSVATVEGKLKTFVSRLINCNEMSKQVPGEAAKPAMTRSSLFDVSFLILTFIVQMYGSNVVLEERGSSFFEKWVRECMMERNKNKSPMNMVHLSDQSKVDELLAHLNSTEGGLKNTSLKWQEICHNIPGMLYHLLMAWENETISATEVKSNLDNIKQRLCCYSVCATSWLCSYIQIVRDDELLKPMNMVQQFLQPSQSPEDAAQQDNFKERLLLTHQIIKKMRHDVHPAPNHKLRALMPSQSLVSQNPLDEQFTEVWKTIVDLGWLPIESTQMLDNLLQSCGPFWLVSRLINEIMQCKYSREMYKTMDMVFALMHLDIERCSIALLHEWLPMILLNKNQKPEMIEPQSTVLARLCVYTILATLDTTSATPTRKRSHPSDSEDMDSVTGPLLKQRKLNPDVASSDTSSSDFITETIANSRNESPAVREPLQSCLQNLFKIFAQFLKCDELSPKINFIFEFLLLLVQCGKEKIKPVLKLLPNGLVQNLLKIITTDEFTVGFILRIYDLNTASGRQSAMTDLCLLRNIELRKESINL